MGRWLSPDWSAKAEPVPYAKLDNPQTLNLYAYVGNNPLTRRDLDGHVIALTCATGSTTCQQDKNTEESRIAANASKTDKNGMKESSLFKETTDKNGKTTMTLDKDAASKWVGGHSGGFNLLNAAIDAKPTISVEIWKYSDNVTDGKDAQGNVAVHLSRNSDPANSVSPLVGYDGKVIPNPLSIVAGHEVLGHALPGIMGWDRSEPAARGTENELRQEQGLPLRDPNSN
jgi:hypothetical protein